MIVHHCDPAHRAIYDPDTEIVTFTAHGAGDGVRRCPGPMDRKRLAKIADLHEWECCDWPSIVALRKPDTPRGRYRHTITKA